MGFLAEGRASSRFELLAPLGRGGFGAVYEARDLHSGQRVALKELGQASGDNLARFKQEFRALMRSQPEAALALIDEAMAPWPDQPFTSHHFGAAMARSGALAQMGGDALLSWRGPTVHSWSTPTCSRRRSRSSP